ncbi:MAG: zinc ABC transporter substrate-binding protein [Phycisphaera sp.]|nr:zinc ABC transporter substrate-binding protein [Phycisphaera sp.]
MHRVAASLSALATVLAAICLGCAPASEPAAPRAAGEKPRVYAPNAALASMIRELSGDGVELVVPWQDGGDPAFWRPSADAVREIQSCDLVVLNGAGYEPWASQAALPRARTVDTTAGVKARLIEVEGEVHSHGPEGEHSHSTIASTTWLSPELARAQADAIASRLSQLLPDQATAIAGRRKGLEESFVEIDAQLARIKALEPRWLASHPVYQYLGQAAGLEIESVHWEPGEMPPEQEWTKFRLTRAAFPRPTAWMLWEGEPGPEIRAVLEKEGVRVAIVPLVPDEDGGFAKSYAALLGRIAAELERR